MATKAVTYYSGGVDAVYRIVSGKTLHLGMFEGEHDTRATATPLVSWRSALAVG